MRSMTGYGRGQAAAEGLQFTVEIQAVNRKQTDISLSLARELSELEPNIRDLINHSISRGRLNVNVDFSSGFVPAQRGEIDRELARSYYEEMVKVKQELELAGDVQIDTLLRAPGVLRVIEEKIDMEVAWPLVEKALKQAMADLIRMRVSEGKHLAEDIIRRLSVVRENLGRVREIHPEVVQRYRNALKERLENAGLEVALDDERLLKEIAYFADRSDISEELTRLESHLAQFAEHLGSKDAVGRTLDFMTQEIYRELNTLGAKANDAEISQNVVACKSEMEKIREQVQNIE